MTTLDRDFFIEAHIADIHFGALNPRKQYQILKEQFVEKLYKLPILDIVSVNGDVFHHKFMANAEAVSLACHFISDLIELCAVKGSTLIIISGTYSHDADQIKLFYPLAAQARERGIDVRIVEEVRFEYVKGKKILCIPEVYGKTEAFYNQFLFHTGPYDSCYMHGTYAGAIYGKDTPNLNSSREPVFAMPHFNFCLGPIIAGHVHHPGCFNKHFYYCGSPYRWQFGEEEDKGFIILLQDTKYHEYAVHYEHIISDKYITVNLDSMLQGDPKEMIGYIAKLMNEEQIRYLRVQFTSDNPENLNVLQTYYRNNDKVRIEYKLHNDNVVQDLQEVEQRYDKYNYLFDKNISPEKKLVQYINQCEGEVYLTYDDLVNILKNL